MTRSRASSIAATTAMAGLATSLVVGLLGDNHLGTILERSLVACACCFAGGLLIGMVLDGVVARHAQQLRDQAEQMERDLKSALDPVEPESDVEPRAELTEPVMTV